MSELYLILRHRLESVVDWVALDTDVLRSARKERGLSYEAMGRQLNVASKTWERYEKDGRIPRHLIPKVAEILRLEIESPAPRKVIVDESLTLDERLTRVEGELARLGDLLEKVVGTAAEN